MALGQIHRAQDVQNITAGAEASVDIQVTGMHFSLDLICYTAAGVPLTAAQIAAEIDEIEVRIDGQTIVQVEPEFLRSMAQYYGQYAAVPDGVIPWTWYRPNLDTFAQRSVWAVGLNQNRSYQVIVRCAAAIPNLSSIQVYVDYDPEDITSGLGSRRKVQQYFRTFAGTGENEERDLPISDANAAWQSIWYGNGATLPDWTRTRVNGREVQTRLPDQLTEFHQLRAGRTPQAAYFTIDFGDANTATSYLALSGVNELAITEFWAGAPGAYRIVLETMENLRPVAVG